MLLPLLLEGRLVRRYQRFLADVETADGLVTAHCPNTGSMQGCKDAGMRVWLSPAANPARKLAWTWELVEVPGDTAPVRVGVHTGRSNGLVREAIDAGRVPALAGYPTIRGQVKYGEGRRILLMAPLHHHFEKSGWKETQVVVRFWIITMLLCLIGLASLKLR